MSCQNIKQGQVAINIFNILFFRLDEKFPGVFIYFILFLTEQCQASLYQNLCAQNFTLP